jgi:tRNA pseudouridine55 synthase
MGHGGTLDPMATGVLIIGVGAGTKRLSDFLSCTKTYDTTVLFGKSSDTYDIAGKTVAEAPYKHITRGLVEEKLGLFRGKIKQVPPIYSALKVDGMKAYEYARSGKELPRELQSREMEVTQCELLDFFDGGKHDFRWPADEADDEEKVARKLLEEPEESSTAKTKGSESLQTDISSEVKTQDADGKVLPDASIQHEPNIRKAAYSNRLSSEAKAALHTHDIPELSSAPSPAPAARIRLTVSSGFYVRSFAHDLGRAVGSMGMMASLVRSRQEDFSCITDDTGAIQALTYDELEQGEAVWGPRVESMLEEWTKKHPVALDRQQRERTGYQNREDFKGLPPKRRGGDGFHGRDRFSGDRRRYDSGPRGGRDSGDKRRRNSSSPERVP